MIWWQRLTALFQPEQYHGWGRKQRYFEGWYYKLITADRSKAIAIIPGIAMDDEGNRQAFIQVLDGVKKTAVYHKFEYDSFRVNTSHFEVRIGENHFTADRIELVLPELKGSIQFENKVPWPSSWSSPGIMGPYAFVPFMECYHGILSMDHDLIGNLRIQGEEIQFDGGKGYTEKDWGHSFPSAYIWMQSNHFSRPGISLKVSVARIPWLRSAFTGFIAGLWLDGRLYQFTTYNNTKLVRCAISAERVQVIMENKKYRLEINAQREEATGLASPIQGMMEGRIEESLTSSIRVDLIDLAAIKSVFKDTGHCAGLEVAGQIEQIII
ncbi:MAG: tocopherol cyclase family protein [Bacteroidia bacterium]|nr:tocopherol cyclase family protein [Bacteroidia bacterium]